MSPSFTLPGDPGGVRGKVGELRARGVQFVQVATGLEAIRTDGWVSLSGDRFRQKFAPEAGRWRDAGAGFQRAATALEVYAAALESAQAKAAWARGEYARGDEVTHRARAAYDADVRRGQREKQDSEAQGIPFTLTILPFHDPGEAIRQGALAAYEQAKGDVRQAASVAAAEVRAGCAGAPGSRSWWETGLAFIGDLFVGIYEGVEGMVQLAMLPQQQLMGFLDDIAALATGRLTVDELAMKYRIQAEDAANFAKMVWEHPGDVAIAIGKGILDWDTWSDDPAKAIGHLIPDIILTIATAGAGKVAGSADDVARGVQGAARAASHLDDLGDLARVDSRLPGATRRLDDLVTCGDPVDVGTGRVVLSATDVVLDGALPLVLTRTYSSTRRAGGWFGSGWVSSFDEALVVDDDGCVLLLADSSALSFPLPQPGMPVTTLAGRRRLSLSVLGVAASGDAAGAAGGYEVSDPVAGQVRSYRRLGERSGVAGLVEVRDRCGRWIRFERNDPEMPELVTAVTTSGGGRVDVTLDSGRIAALSVLDRGEPILVRRFGYDPAGRLAAVWVGGHDTPTRFVYDDAGRMSGWVDTNDTRYDYSYDAAGRCVRQGSPNGDLAYSYDYSGHDEATGHRVTLVTDSLGAVRRYLVDAQARVAAEVDPLGAVTTYDYDEWGNPVAVTDPLGAVTRAAYTELGQLARVERADGSVVTMDYDPRWHRPVEVIGPDGATERMAYDERGQLVAHTEPTGATTRFDYDERGFAAAVIDPAGARSELSCNDAGLLLQVTDPLGVVTRWERDGFGRVLAQVDALGGRIEQHPDTEGRVVRLVQADGSAQTWEFDGEGNCVRHVDAGGHETRMDYERFDLLTTRTDPTGAQVRYSYDTELRLTACVNELGLQWSYEHDPLGRVLREVDYNGRVVDYRRDLAGRVTQRRNAAGQTVDYQHDPLGRVVRTATSDGVTAEFEYDTAGRLVRAHADGVQLERSYDTAGRLLRESVDGQVMTLDYDAAGRRVRRVTPSGLVSDWRHDALGQPVELRTGGHLLAFARDPLGREVGRDIDTDLTVTSTWDGLHRLVGRSVAGSRAAAGIRTEVSYAASGEVASIVDSRWGATQYQTDAAGRVVSARMRGAEVERYRYDPAGNIVQGTWPLDAQSPDLVDSAAAVGDRDYRGTLVTRAGRDRFDYDAEGRLVVRRRHTLPACPRGGRTGLRTPTAGRPSRGGPRANRSRGGLHALVSGHED